MLKKELLFFTLFVPFLSGCKSTKYFQIKFVNFDNTLLETTKVKEGEIPKYYFDNPTRDKTKEITYKFNGWDSPLVAAKEDKTYKATYREVENYEVLFLDENENILKEENIDIETIQDQGCPYKGTVPSKSNVGGVYYYFDGFNEVNKNNELKKIKYKASFKECEVDDDRDYDGLVDYLDPYPNSNEFNINLSFENSTKINVGISNCKFNFNFKSLFIDSEPNDFDNDIMKLGIAINFDKTIDKYGQVAINEDIKPVKTYSSLYDRFGFDDISEIDLEPELFTLDKNDVGVAHLAHKKIKIKDYSNLNNEATYKDLIVIATGFNNDSGPGWYSNFDVGCDNIDLYKTKEGEEHDFTYWNESNKKYHKGLYNTSMRLIKGINNSGGIEDYIKNYSSPIVFVTGYSRAGGLANIIGEYINSNSLASKLYCYTFGSPNTYFGDVDESNNNIFNIVNEDDIVPNVLFSTIKDENDKPMQKFGVNKNFSISKNYTSKYYNLTRSKYSYVSNLINLLKDRISSTRDNLYNYSDESVKLSNDKNTYIRLLKNLNLTDNDISNYFKFNEGDNLTVNTSLIGFGKIGAAFLSGVSIDDTKSLYELASNYSKLIRNLIFNGLTSISSVALPHYLTTYYVGCLDIN